MTCFNPTIADADYCPNDEANWAGFVPTLSMILAGDVNTLPTFPARGNSASDRSAVTGNFAAKTGKKWAKFQLVKDSGIDDFTGKGAGGEHRFKARIQHSLHNLKLVEDLSGCELYAHIKALDGEPLLFGHPDYPAKIERVSIKASKGQRTGDANGRYIEFDIVSTPYSAFNYAGTVSYTPAV